MLCASTRAHTFICILNAWQRSGFSFTRKVRNAKKVEKGGNFVRIFRFYGHFSMWRLQLGAQKTLVFSSVRQTKTCYLYG